MTNATTRAALLATAVVLLLLGAGTGYWLAQRGSPVAPAVAPATEREVLYWYDPMAPDKHFERPGKSPFMDMQLVPKYADEVAATGVRIDPALRQNVGIRTARVEIGRLPARLSVPGTLSWDLRRERIVSARVDALVTRVHVTAPYTRVRRGQALATLLAPQWSTALAESRALSQATSDASRALRDAARQRLRVIGAEGGGATDGSVTLRAPYDGVATEVLVREGQTVSAGTALYRINGTETLWLEAAVPQAEAGRLAPGTAVQASVSAVPGEAFDGVIESVIPQIEPASRTQQARIVLNNPKGVLAPGMFAEVRLQPRADKAVPLVPTEALISTGEDSRVIVQNDDGTFLPVHVRSGRSAGDRTEILAGLEGGERIVVSGQFLVDSEASLSGALTRLGAPATDAAQTDPHAAHRAPAPSKPVIPAEASSPTHDHGASPTSSDAKRNCPVAYWYDPMVPDKHFSNPGKSPYMDMQLVPRFAADADESCSAEDAGAATAQDRRP
jgi:Cu(I)/Ag(I) efflux system membrane fusion protein